MKTKILNVINLVAFLSVSIIMLSALGYISSLEYNKERQKLLFSTQQENSIDIAFIGSSSTYCYFDPMVVWENYGITSLTYAVPSAPFDFTIPLMEIAIKNQTPELFVIDLRNLLIDEFNTKFFGSYTRENLYKANITGLKVFEDDINKLLIVNQTPYFDTQEYLQYADVLYYHNDFTKNIKSFYNLADDYTSSFLYKGNGYYQQFKYKDFSELGFTSFEAQPSDYELTDSTKERLDELFEYCEKNNYEAIFVFSPYISSLNAFDSQIRYKIGEYIEEAGYEFLDHKIETDLIGFDYSKDFHDQRHTNILGAQKYTDYFMNDILKIYNIEPKYEQDVIDDWNHELSQWEEHLSEVAITILD